MRITSLPVHHSNSASPRTTATAAVVRPFHQFLHGAPSGRNALRTLIAVNTRRPEAELLPGLLAQAQLPAEQAQAVQQLALRLSSNLREQLTSSSRVGLAQQLLQEYALSSQEGVALMCLAEALLRIPDQATRDALIRDKISQGRWSSHRGHSPSLFVNAATWGLMLTGELVAAQQSSGLSAVLWRLVDRGGEPLVRAGVDMAMRLLGEQFVAGPDVMQALARAEAREAQGYRYSYDMLGEAALTAADARRYIAAYAHAIHAVGQASGGRGIYKGPGVSIKLSALHPRYGRAQHARVMSELYPALLHLVQLARRYDIAINLDAEESERLDISLDVLERLCNDPGLAGWNGIGFVVQAYQKRAPQVIDYLIDLARRTARRLMLRLVKGAYWDSEIKRAQLEGQTDYPVYTRKAYTDVAYLACAKKLLAVPEAIYPQFATHNAQTLATIYQLADPAKYHPTQYEFQCLHGMGEALYDQVVGPEAKGKLERICRIYAPVGTHASLLPYLVRRLLENGANTSFVHQLADTRTPLDELIEDPIHTVMHWAAVDGRVGASHPLIPAPASLYPGQRVNSVGLDLNDENQLYRLWDALRTYSSAPWYAAPMLAQELIPQARSHLSYNPADPRDALGRIHDATEAEIDLALTCATQLAHRWADLPPAERAARLDAAARLLQADMPRLMALLIRETGKTCTNALAEVREAIDALRYYAAQVRQHFGPTTHLPLGVVVCISPWNFPLAIFLGQIGAALAAGNVVIAKPAEQTPLIAAEAVRLLWQAGIPPHALQMLPGAGQVVGARLVADPRVSGVLFTGSTEVARLLQRQLVGRLDMYDHPVALVAETGGQNAMIVDSSALLEQVVADVLQSAFDSAGQRCSALRLLCVQAEVANRLIEMLQGAMAELRVGNPDRLEVDVGPVIDATARDRVLTHIAQMRSRNRVLYQATRGVGPPLPDSLYVPPTLVELTSVDELGTEVFGPVLHLLRYPRGELPALLQRINALGYGLTMGLHTRIDDTMHQVERLARVGTLYVNRNMVGAVVGVQPFGGEGLSGTGPKAGGPLYLYRLLARAPADVMHRALQHAHPRWAGEHPSGDNAALAALATWAEQTSRPELAQLCLHFAEHSWVGASCVLPGPTGERNTYTLYPRDAVLCLAETPADRLVQLAAVLAVRAPRPVAARTGRPARTPAPRRATAHHPGARTPSPGAARRSGAVPRQHRGPARHHPQPSRPPRPHRRRPGPEPRRPRHPPRTTADRARTQHQHRRSGR